MNDMVKQEATLILVFFIAECGRYQLWQIPPALIVSDPVQISQISDGKSILSQPAW